MEWVVNPREFIPEFEATVAKITEEVAIEIFSGVVERTPVRTGNLRASWRINVGSEDKSTTNSGTIASPAEAPRIPKTLGVKEKYPVIFVSNNQPYAGYVNDGTSKSAPVNMVELTLESLKTP